MKPQEILRTLLSPQGIKTVTTGGGEVAGFLEARFGTTETAAVEAVWLDEIERVAGARLAIIGVPCDVGAGFERGSFKGPLAIRTGLLAADGLYEAMGAAGVVDLGDVRVNPQLLDDEYYRPELLEQVRRSRGRDDALAVAPLSALRAALNAALELNPGLRFIVLGGDHSLSRIPVEVLVEGERNTARDLGVLHFDAHTDLLDMRDGVPYNFATWAHHANDAIGRGRRLVQLGVRVSGRPREAWEGELDLRQIRMDEIAGMPDDAVVDEVVGTLERSGVRRVYISNDIDATDPRFAAATGTMEPGGLSPELVLRTISEVASHFDVVGSDVVEVAPPLKWHVPGEPARTIRTACRYVVGQIEASLGVELPAAYGTEEPADADVVSAFPPLVDS